MALCKVINLNDKYSKEVSQILRELADQADDGELIGLALAALYQDRQEDYVGMAGMAGSAPDRTSYLLQRLNSALVHLQR